MNELGYMLEQSGFPNGSSGGMNKGGTVDVDGVRFTMTNAFHSSWFDGSYAGEPAGLVITLEDGLTVYFAGDTYVFGDMQLIGRIYEPSSRCCRSATTTRWARARPGSRSSYSAPSAACRATGARSRC